MISASLGRIGAVALFLLRVLGQCLPALAKPRAVIHQIYNAGARSLIIIMLCGLFVGMVLGLQGFDLLQRFGSEDALGVAAALGLLKELGPVVTALLFAGRAGTALTSEIGLMRATDQLTAMEMMAVDPGAFWSQMQAAVELDDVYEGIVKSICFGFACSLIAVYEGYHAPPTAQGVGLATTRTVVVSSVLVLLIDYMLTAAFLGR